MDVRSSEMTKYAANAMLATRISFMNQIANVCERVGADAMKVMRGMGSDSRIGPKFLFPGVGFGGSCFPKDVRALIKTSKDFGYDFSILRQVMAVNEAQRTLFLDKIREFYGNDLKGKKFAVWGLAFKPNTDDMREAPAIDIISGLIKNGATCFAYDPKAMEPAAHIFADNQSVAFGKSPYEVLDGVDGLILLTEWFSFREPDFDRMKSLMQIPVIFDGRNQYNPKVLARLGIQYVCIGRPNAAEKIRE
jgi:UDPglucose 6-dehydrogenase